MDGCQGAFKTGLDRLVPSMCVCACGWEWGVTEVFNQLGASSYTHGRQWRSLCQEEAAGRPGRRTEGGREK